VILEFLQRPSVKREVVDTVVEPPAELDVRGFLDAVPALMFATGPDGLPTYVNSRLVEYTGRRLDEYLTAGCRDLIHPHDVDETTRTWSEAAHAGVAYRGRFRFRRHDGEYRWFEATADPLRGHDGRVRGFFLVLIDVHERTRREEELRRSRQYLAEAQALTHTGSWAWSPVTNSILYWSEECYRVNGFDPSEGIPSFEASLGRIHPDDRAAVVEKIGRNVREGTEFEVDYRLLLPDGRVRDAHVFAHPVHGALGNLVEYIGTIIDVTEPKRAEQERREHLGFLECLDRINVAMQRTSQIEQVMSGVVDEALAIFRCDRAWLAYPCDPNAASCRVVMERTSPLYPAPVALGQEIPVGGEIAGLFGRVLAARGAASEGLVTQAMREAYGVNSMAGIVIRPQGDRPYLFGLDQCSGPRTWTSAECRLLEEIGRRLESVLTNLLAQRNLLASQEELRLARERLAHASKIATVAELSASIAHEINQPLQAVVSNGHACLRWLDAQPTHVDNARRTAERVVRDANAAADVVGRIRALFGHAAPAKAEVDVNELIVQVCALMANEMFGNAISLEKALAKDTPAVKADAVQIQQVVVNLVRNAIESLATMDGGPRILSIRSRRDAANAVVDVSDNGPGPADMNRIFEPFVTTKEAGMGMGLAICRSIVEAHAGRLRVERNEPRGVTFTFSLPVGVPELH
jgi:PAS domain S-box-containing protein